MLEKQKPAYFECKYKKRFRNMIYWAYFTFKYTKMSDTLSLKNRVEQSIL